MNERRELPADRPAPDSNWLFAPEELAVIQRLGEVALAGGIFHPFEELLA